MLLRMPAARFLVQFSIGAIAISVAALSGSATWAETTLKKKPKSVIIGLSTAPQTDEPRVYAVEGAKKKKAASQTAGTNINGQSTSGPATTKTEILAGQNIAPMLSPSSSAALIAAEARYAQIVASGGWPQVPKGTLKKGAEGEDVSALNRRLYIEGYLRKEGAEGVYLPVFTAATEEALIRFQRNNGLAGTGFVDGTTLRALNIPAEQRLSTIRANIPRLEIYGRDLGTRYLLVNIPAQQAEAVANGSVYARHNAVVGRPERPTPVVMTPLTKIKFNPYWNAPASIVERDIIPRIQKGGTRVLSDMDITVFQGVGGPEVDPDTVDWDYAIADDFHFRQEPGPKNAMATAKVEFESPFGIYLHDTPEKKLFGVGQRFFSSGCVRIEQMSVLVNWVLNGQEGYNASRISALGDSLERVDVSLATPPQLRVAYLTAWPVGNTVAFRKDIYDLDTSGFTVGQPMPVGESAPDGSRFTLKPIPRLIAESDGDGSFFSFGKSRKGRAKGEGSSFFDFGGDDEDGFQRPKQETKSVILGLNAPSKASAKKSLSAKKENPEKKKEAKATKSVIAGLNGADSKKAKVTKPKKKEPVCKATPDKPCPKKQ
jgi:L,D-transpeptidase YcbB